MTNLVPTYHAGSWSLFLGTFQILSGLTLLQALRIAGYKVQS